MQAILNFLSIKLKLPVEFERRTSVCTKFDHVIQNVKGILCCQQRLPKIVWLDLFPIQT